MTEWVHVCALADLPPGAKRVVDVAGVSVLVVNHAGELYAVEDVCSHDGDALGDGPVRGAEVICPRHGARFCLKTGAALSAPAYEPIATFPVQVVEGEVQVSDPRW